MCVGGGGKQPREAGGRQHRHQSPARPRRLSAPPRYWRRRSRAISLRQHHAHSQPGERRHLHGGSGKPGGRGATRRVLHNSAESDCLLRLHLLLLRCLLPSSPPAAAFPFSFACRRHRCRRRRSTNYIRATPRLRPSANLGSFRRAPPLPPSALLPSPRSSGRPPSANLGSLGFSSSSEAWLAAWRALSSFRLPLLFLTLTSDHCYSSLRRVLPGDPLEAGSGGPGVRGEGAVFGRRTVGRERSHLGLSTGGRATARAPRRGRRRGEGALGERSGRRLPPLRAGRAGRGGRQALSGRRADCDPGASSASSDRSCPRGGGQRATAPLGPVPGTGPGHPPQTGCFARHRPATGRGRLELRAAG